MKAKDLYIKLDKDFCLDKLKDDWSFMNFNQYIASSFREKYMGIVLNNSRYIEKVYTATMPDIEVFDELIDSNETDILLFSHHAMGYNPKMEGFPFYNIQEEYLSILKKRRISFYVLHVPLDKNGVYSTSVNLARGLSLEIVDEFCEYGGIKCGVICETELKNINELAERVSSVVGHETKLLKHGDDIISKGLVAIAAGGGSMDFVAKEIAERGLNTYITGNTRHVPSFQPVVDFHRIIKEEKINVIGATHYSTEKFACIAMVEYFQNLGLQSEFVEGKYFLEDL